MRPRFGLLIVSLATFGLGASIVTADQNTALCPEKIETTQRSRAPVEGYEAVVAQGKHFWNVVAFYEGRPEQMVSLHYDTEVDTPDHGSILTWNLDPKTEYWIECGYSATSIVLRKKLPPVGQCQAFYSGEKLEEVGCR